MLFLILFALGALAVPLAVDVSRHGNDNILKRSGRDLLNYPAVRKFRSVRIQNERIVGVIISSLAIAAVVGYLSLIADRLLQIDTFLAFFAAALGLAALLYGYWWTLRRAKQGWRERRLRLGFEALSRGLVAVAAGDAEAARLQDRRAQALLDGQPLTMLLSAQAALLQGDERLASRIFSAMRERSETELLGLRGLLAQSIKREDYDEALRLAERAYQINPKSEWVIATLYDLRKRVGHWAEAQAILQLDTARQVVAPEGLGRERAELLLKQSEQQPGGHVALRLAKRAHDADPAYPPATARYARLLISSGLKRGAARAIERTWARHPDPELVVLYAEAKQAYDAVAKVKAAKQLAGTNPSHPDSHIAVATAALEAHLWGEARTSLMSIAGDDASPRICRLMAELEEAEYGDAARARSWLMRASGDEHGPGMPSPAPQMPEPLTPSGEALPRRS